MNPPADPSSVRLLPPLPEAAQVPESLRPLAARLQALLEAAATDPLVPGVMAAVHAPRLGLHWCGAVRGARGHAADPVDAGTPFRIASITKPFVAAALLRLVEQGRIALHTRVGPLVSAHSAALLVRGGHDPARITLSQLLAHIAGLPDHTHDPLYPATVQGEPAKVWTRHEQIELAAGMAPVTSAPGQRFAYSDTGYVVLGEVVERLTGRPLGPSVRSLLDFDALGLRHTHWETQEADPRPERRRARQGLGGWDAGELDASFDLYGGGGLLSTVDDLCRFMRALVLGQVFRQPGTLAAALMVPPAERAAGAAVHAHAAMTLPMGPAWGWGHLGFWGCGVVCSGEHDVTVASTVNQPLPADAELRRRLLSEIGGAVIEAQVGA